MSTFNHVISGTPSANLNTLTANSGETWATHPTNAGSLVVSGAGADRLASNGAQTSLYKSTWVAGSANYDVTGTFTKNGTNEGYMFLTGRMDATAATYYSFGHYIGGAGSVWQLLKYVAGVQTVLQNYANEPANGTVFAIKLEMRGSTIKGFIDGVERCSAVDTAITGAGLIGLMGYTGGAQMNLTVMGAVDAPSSVAVSGNTSMGDFLLAGTIAPDGSMSMSGETGMGDYTLSGTIGIGTGTITTQAFKNWGGTLIAAATVIPFTKVIRCSDAATLQETANLALNGSSQLVMPSALFVAGVKYLVVNFNAAGTVFSAEAYTAT